MSITKSYNKHTDTYYAYETTYVWSEERQKKIQKKVCIGQYDEAGNIVPNAKRGRPSRKIFSAVKEAETSTESNGLENTEEINHAIAEILSEIHQIEESISDLASKSQELESKVAALQTKIVRKA